MKIMFFIVLCTVCFSPIFTAEGQTIVKSDIDQISDSIKALNNSLKEKQNQIDLLKNEITDTKSLIEVHDNQITTKLNEITNQDNSIEQLLKTHSDESFSSENLWHKLSELEFVTSILVAIITTAIGIAAGAYISTQYESKKRQSELKDAHQQMQKEFSRLHSDVWMAILDTRDVIRDQHQNMMIINRLINRQTSVHDEFVRHIHGLHFILWDFTLPHMGQFKEDEKDKLMRIHNFITGVNELLINHHHNALNDKLQQILGTQNSNGVLATLMRDELIIDFNARMKIYGAVYRKIKNLNIDWLQLTTPMVENNNEAKSIAWKSLVLTSFISIGASVMAVGMSLVFTILPLLNDMIKSGMFTDQDAKLIMFLNNNVLFFLFTGLVIIGVSVYGGYRAFHKK